MMKLEIMTNVESVNCKAVRGQFARDHGNVMLIERAVRYVIRFLVGQISSEDWHNLKAEVMATQILHVHGREDWCKGGVDISCGRISNM